VNEYGWTWREHALMAIFGIVLFALTGLGIYFAAGGK